MLTDCDEIEFMEKLNAEYDISPAIKINHTKHHFAQKGLNAKREGKFRDAIGYFNSSIELAVKDLMDQHDNAPIRYVGNSLELVDATKMNKEDVELVKSVLLQRGLACLELKEYSEALKNFEESLMIDPDYYDAMLHKGTVLASSQRIDEAIEALTELVNKFPTAQSYYNRGVAYCHLGNFDMARADFDGALSIDPNYELAKKVIGKLDNPNNQG